jgi:hypothetical protein
MINNSRISKLLSKVDLVKPTDDKAVRKLFEAQEGGEKYSYVPKSRVGYRPNPDGTESTHLMAREYIPGKGWVVFPTLYQNSNNEWTDMGEIHGVNWWPIYEYAQQVGELYEFGEDEEDAINFADKGSWKENMNKRPFFKTRLGPADELRFQKFFKTLPENLQTDDDLYDIRGYWDAEGKPDEFDYSQEKQEDNQHHAYSRHPYTGKILKSPAHPTFQEAMENETHKRVDVYGNIYTGLPKFQEAGKVMDKDGYIDVEKQFGINPLSEDGLVLVQQLHKEYPDAKFICTAQGCAQIASDAAAASGDSFSRSNAWDIGNRNSVDYTNPAYEGQIGQGALPDPDWNRQFPPEIFTAGNMVGLNRYNSESSYHYADQDEFSGSRGYEHIGYMIDDSTLLHGTGATGEHPAYFILDSISDNRIKLPHYGSYEPVESIAPAGYLKSMSNFMGDVTDYIGFEEGGNVSQMGYRDDSQYRDRDYIDIETENGVIDMSQTGERLLATDLETGEQRVLQPYSGLHKFVGKKIRERKLPKAQDGRQFRVMPASTTEVVMQQPQSLEKILSTDEQTGKGQEQLKWVKKWHNSPMYLKMLQDSAGDDWEIIRDKRLENLNSEKASVHVHDEASLPEGNDNFLGWSNNEGVSIAPLGYDSFGTFAHEFMHASDNVSGFDQYNFLLPYGDRVIPEADVNKIQKYAPDDYLELFKHQYPSSKYNFDTQNEKYKENYRKKYDAEYEDADGGKGQNRLEYVTRPTETRARVGDARWRLHELGIYDPFNELLTREKFNQLIENKDNIRTKLKGEVKQSKGPLEDLLEMYGEDEVFDMINTLSKEDSQPQQNFDQYVQQSMAKMGGEYQDGGMTDPNAKLVRQRTKRNGDVVSIVIKKSPGQGFSRYKITTRNGEVIKVSEIHGEGGFEDEDYVPYTPNEMYMQQNQFEIRPEPNSQNNRNINNFEINKKK